MRMYSSKQLLTSLLQFFALAADAQLDYVQGIPTASGRDKFPFGLEHSPLIEMANGLYNIARVMAADGTVPEPTIESLQELEAIALLIVSQPLGDYGTTNALSSAPEWRLVRKLSRHCLEQLSIPQQRPEIPYEELIPLIMD